MAIKSASNKPNSLSAVLYNVTVDEMLKLAKSRSQSDRAIAWKFLDRLLTEKDSAGYAMIFDYKINQAVRRDETSEKVGVGVRQAARALSITLKEAKLQLWSEVPFD